MKFAYMPFTYLPESTARILSALVGPFVVYKPMENRIAESLATLADQGVVEIRTPIAGDEQRLVAALNEFTQWAAQNPGHATAGAGFVGAQQGKIPFFDETTINRIRTEIKTHREQPDVKDDETSFSARLFLSVAEENDITTATLDQELKQFESLEQGFLESLVDGDEADFKRQLLGGGVWQEDPGAKQTAQRIRAWACLATADDNPPDCLVTTSKAVMDTLIETFDPKMAIQQVGAFRCPIDLATQPLLEKTLTDLLDQDTMVADSGNRFSALGSESMEKSRIAVSVYMVAAVPLSRFIGRIAPAATFSSVENNGQTGGKHTLILLVEPDSKAN